MFYIPLSRHNKQIRGIVAAESFPSTMLKTKNAFASLIHDLKIRDPLFEEASRTLFFLLEKGEITSKEAEKIYHKELTNAILRQRLK